MKLIIENFRKFLAEQILISDRGNKTKGNIILYHISGAEDIEELDPDVAARNLKNSQQQNIELGTDPGFLLLVLVKWIQAWA